MRILKPSRPISFLQPLGVGLSSKLEIASKIGCAI